MITATRLTRALGILGVIGFMAHATSSLATSEAYQDPLEPSDLAPASAPVDAAPPPSVPEPLKDLPPAPEEPALDAAPLPAPASEEPAPADEKPRPAPTPAPAAVAESLPPAVPIEETNPLPPARERTTPPPPHADEPPTPPAADLESEEERLSPRSTWEEANPSREPVDDPDAHARSFVERNRREAEEQLKSLRQEAAQLKGRLARVEAGIRRWEALADAMNRSVQEKAAVASGEDARLFRSRGTVEYGVPIAAPPGAVILSQPITRSNYVPVPQPR